MATPAETEVRGTVRGKPGGGWARHALRLRLLFTALLVAGSYVLALRKGAAYAFPAREYLLINGTAILLALPSLFRCLADMFRRARATADLLVWVIALAALGTGQWLEAAVVILISLLAEVLTQEAARQAQGISLSGLLGARRVTIRDGEGQKEIPLNELQKDQIVVVRQGQTIPVDGVVVSGQAEVHEAALTGESIYQVRVSGHRVLAGGITESGAIEIRAEKVGADTLLAQVDRLVHKALSKVSRRDSLMDRFARYYVGAVFVLGLVVFMVYGQVQHAREGLSTLEALRRALVVMLAVSPAALILAGPLTLYAGLLRAARRGILFKGVSVLETLARVSVLLLDKTGTLTYARPKVTSLATFGAGSEEDLLRSALMVEQHSGHPIAKAICEYATARHVAGSTPDKFHEFEGGGACAMKGDLYFKVGALWLMEDGREIPPEVNDWLARTQQQGYTAVLVADRTRILGGIALEDEIRGEAKTILQRIRQAGIKRLVMVTGDNRETAERVREAVGVDEVVADCMPDQKMVRLNGEKRRGLLVGMVGDGINDAPALAVADVGIAMSALGSDLAIEASDVALLNNDLNGLYDAVSISRQTVAAEKFSLALAIVANLVFLGLALFERITLLGGSVLQLAVLALVGLNALHVFARRT